MSDLSAENKAALLLSSLGTELMEAVLTRLPDEQAQRLRTLVAQLEERPPKPEDVNAAMQEFMDLMRIADRPPIVPPRASPTAPAAPAEPPAPAPSPPAPAPAPEIPPAEGEATVSALRTVPLDLLAQSLRDERVPTVALVLSCLEAGQAVQILRVLPPELRYETVVRMGKPAPVARPVLVSVARTVLEKCRKLSQAGGAPTGDDRVRRLADMVRALGREDRTVILQRMEENDAATAAQVRKLLYRFSDVLRVDDRTLQGILSQLDMKTLAAALKNAEEEVKTKVMSNVSKRAREAVNEEMELSGMLPATKVEEAQGKITSILRKLDEEGKLSLTS